jgi:hypothetical protein
MELPMKETLRADERDLDLDPVIEAYKKDIDRSLIRENLRLSVEQRFEKLMSLQEFAAQLRQAGREPEEPQ